MILPFSKMHSLGNDFVVIDGVRNNVEINADTAAFIADRHLGIGCDQILIAEASDSEDAEFRFRIFNADGSESAQCGNGARCFARFLVEQGLANGPKIHVRTLNTFMKLEYENPDNVRVDMGQPVFDHRRIPFTADSGDTLQQLQTSAGTYTVNVLSMGNPHAVMQVTDISTADVEGIGPVIESHNQFPERTNVGFMQIINDNRIDLRVFERGVGETRACGSGACAAVVSGRRLGLLGRRVDVQLPGGFVNVEWDGQEGSVILSGNAVHVFDGNLNL